MPGTDLALIRDAAVEAGRIALGHWRRSPEVWDKGGDDPVSAADLAVDAFLKDALLGARGDYGWLSEETADDGTRLTAPRVFVVDPIDGTRSFLKGEETWGVSIAVVEDGVPVAGVVHLPARDKTYAAARGAAATLNDAPIRAADRTDPDGATVLTRPSTLKPDHWRGEAPAMTRVFRPSIAYRLGLVAEGRFDAMMTLTPAWDWDVAAGVCIATAAGAIATDAAGSALSFDRRDARQPGILVAGPGLHAALARRLTPRPRSA